MEKRVIVFVDGPNFFFGLKESFKCDRVDLQILTQKLCAVNRQLVQIRYYDSPFEPEVSKEGAISQQKYIEDLKSKPGIFVTLGKYVKRPVRLRRKTYELIKPCLKDHKIEGFVEKGVDVALAVDMVALAHQDMYDTAILVSGDGDFVHAINAVKAVSSKAGPRKKVQVAYFEDDERKCYDVKARADSFINLCHIIPAVLRVANKAKKP